MPHTCDQLDEDPTICPPCEEHVETNEAANMAAPAAEDQETDELVHIEDVSRKTTIREILKIAADRLHYLGFPKMDLKMGFLQQTSKEPQECDVAASSPQADFPSQVLPVHRNRPM